MRAPTWLFPNQTYLSGRYLIDRPDRTLSGSVRGFGLAPRYRHDGASIGRRQAVRGLRSCIEHLRHHWSMHRNRVQCPKAPL